MSAVAHLLIMKHKTSPPRLSRRLRDVIQKGSSIMLFAGLILAPVMQSQASDHIDSPTIAQDRGSDIADMWAFLDPNDNSQVVLVLSTQGFIVSGEHFGQVILITIFATVSKSKIPATRNPISLSMSFTLPAWEG